PGVHVPVLRLGLPEIRGLEHIWTAELGDLDRAPGARETTSTRGPTGRGRLESAAACPLRAAMPVPTAVGQRPVLTTVWVVRTGRRPIRCPCAPSPARRPGGRRPRT